MAVDSQCPTTNYRVVTLGISFIRNEVVNFLERRDGHNADPENIFLTDGASQGVQTILRTLIRHSYDGIMVPIPQVGISQVAFIAKPVDLWPFINSTRYTQLRSR